MRVWVQGIEEDVQGGDMSQNSGRSRMSDDLIAALRQRVEERYYDQPHVIEIIAQAILHSRGLYL